MHRIKLNDRMSFPEELDMSTFIDIEDEVNTCYIFLLYISLYSFRFNCLMYMRVLPGGMFVCHMCV